jgi:hypothetical protein
MLNGDGPSPWQNPLTPLDVNSDGQVTPVDALQVANALNEHGPGPLAGRYSSVVESSSAYLDTNGDRALSAADFQLIVGQLNDAPSAPTATDQAQADSLGTAGTDVRQSGSPSTEVGEVSHADDW